MYAEELVSLHYCLSLILHLIDLLGVGFLIQKVDHCFRIAATDGN